MTFKEATYEWMMSLDKTQALKEMDFKEGDNSEISGLWFDPNGSIEGVQIISEDKVKSRLFDIFKNEVISLCPSFADAEMIEGKTFVFGSNVYGKREINGVTYPDSKMLALGFREDNGDA